MKINTNTNIDYYKLLFQVFGSFSIIFLIFINHELITKEISYVFNEKRLLKEKKRQIKLNIKQEEKEKERDSLEEDLSEQLKEENIDLFLKDCKDKYKNSQKGFLNYFLDDQEKIEKVFFGDLSNLELNKSSEEIDEIMNKRLNDKYYRDLAKVMIVTKLMHKKMHKIQENKNKNSLNEEEEESDENELEIIDNINQDNLNKNENEYKKEEKIENENIDKDNINDNDNDNNNINNNYIDNNKKYYSVNKKKFISFRKIFFDFFIFFIDLIFSYFTAILLLLFITHLDKNRVCHYGYFFIYFLILIKVK